jgi:hypothetical protein
LRTILLAAKESPGLGTEERVGACDSGRGAVSETAAGESVERPLRLPGVAMKHEAEERTEHDAGRCPTPAWLRL